MPKLTRSAKSRVYLLGMSIISGDELRKRVEWARNNGKASSEPGGSVRFEHEGKMYVVPAELLVHQAGSVDGEVELSLYTAPD